MNSQNKRLAVPIVVILSGLLLLLVIFGHLLGIPIRILTPMGIFMGIAIFAIGVWLHAADHADGSEWWQDDDSSGWRGY